MPGSIEGKPQVTYEEGDAQVSVNSLDLKTGPDLSLPDSLRHMTEEELQKFEKKTMRKVDLRLLPMLVLMYILNYLDRNNIATARVSGMQEHLQLTDTQYQTAISVLFIGYISMQIPSNIIMQKTGRPSAYMAVVMTVWGIISTCTGAVQSYGGLIAIRVLLGFVEAGFFGSALYLLSSWYTKKELTLRNSILYSGSLLSGAFSGLIAAGITEGMADVRGLDAWRWLFIIEGAITVAIVPLGYFILPDMPANTKFLSQQEKDLLLWKLRQDVGQDDSDAMDSDQSTKHFIMLAFKDQKVWMVTGILSFLVASAGVTNFFPSVVGTLGFDKITTLCLTAPPYILAVVCTFFWSRHADQTGERFWHVVAPLGITLASFIISAATLNIGARYFAMCIMIPSIYSSFTTILAWLSNSVPRPPMKRAISLSLMNCLSNSTSIWNSYLYSGEPRYALAFTCNSVFVLLAISLAVILRFKLINLNKKIERGTMEWEKELGKGNDGSNISPDFRFLY